MRVSRLAIVLSMVLGACAGAARASVPHAITTTPSLLAEPMPSPSPLDRPLDRTLGATARQVSLALRPAGHRGDRSTRLAHAPAVAGHTLVHAPHALRAHRHLHLHLARLHRHAATRAFARAEPHTPAQRPHEHSAPPPPPAPTQVNFHRHGPDSRGGVFALPASPTIGAAMRGSIARESDHPRVASSESPVHVGRGPPALLHPTNARPAVAVLPGLRLAPSARRPLPPAPAPNPFATPLPSSRSPFRARPSGACAGTAVASVVVPVVPTEPSGSRTAKPGGGRGAFHQTSTGDTQ